MPWRHYQELRTSQSNAPRAKRRFSVTADILAFEMCPVQYGTFKVRRYEPALAVQLFYGTVIHQVLDRAHTHYRGLIGPGTSGSLPTDDDIEGYFQDVANSLRARRIGAAAQVKDQALQVLQRFNRLEGPSLYPRVLSTECRLQADQGPYILHGNVDVLAVALGTPGAEEIWDYKGGSKPSIREPVYERYIFQMQVYSELYRRRTGRAPARAVLYFLNELAGAAEPVATPANAILEVPLDPAVVGTAMDSFSQTVQSIERCRDTNSWPGPAAAPPIETCNACDLRWTCSFITGFGRSYRLLYP